MSWGLWAARLSQSDPCISLIIWIPSLPPRRVPKISPCCVSRFRMAPAGSVRRRGWGSAGVSSLRTLIPSQGPHAHSLPCPPAPPSDVITWGPCRHNLITFLKSPLLTPSHGDLRFFMNFEEAQTFRLLQVVTIIILTIREISHPEVKKLAQHRMARKQWQDLNPGSTPAPLPCAVPPQN